MTGGATLTHSLFPLYVLVLNWNLPDDTIACVDSLLAGAPPGVSVVIVDNGSTDQSVDVLQHYFGARVTIIALSVNVGFAAGMNAGIRHALEQGARSVLLLNNDTIIAPSMLHHLAQAAHALPQAAVLGPLIYYHDQPRRVWRCGDREYPWLPFPLRVSARALERAGMPPLRVDYVTGCAMLVRRAVFERVGLLDPRYFMYFEDADFCRRARQHGFQVWCVPRAQMWHKVSQSSRTNKPASRSMQAWGRAFFFRRHPHGAVPGLTTLYLLAKVMWNSVQDIRLGEWHLLRPLWRGTLEGFAGTGPTSLSDFRSATSTSRADTV